MQSYCDSIMMQVGLRGLGYASYNYKCRGDGIFQMWNRRPLEPWIFMTGVKLEEVVLNAVLL